MTHGLIRNLEDRKWQQLDIMRDNTRMREENDENESGFIGKYLGNVKIEVDGGITTLLISDFVVSV